jgi:Zn-dependent peptidase ImmA (M78 family)
MGMSRAVSPSIAIPKEKAQSNTKTEKATYTVAHGLCHAISHKAAQVKLSTI